MRLSYIKLAWTAAKCVYKTMIDGEKEHGTDGRKKQSVRDHKYHASEHCDNELGGDASEDHIAHAMTRCTMIKYLEVEHDT